MLKILPEGITYEFVDGYVKIKHDPNLWKITVFDDYMGYESLKTES